jgi:hypothetical protein
VVVKPAALSIDEFLRQQGWDTAVQQWKSSHVAGRL